MLPRFLSRKRKCYGDYERKQILEAVEDIDPDTFATSEELDAAKAQIGALQKQIDDNDGDDDQTAAFAKAGLGLGVTGFVFGAAPPSSPAPAALAFSKQARSCRLNGT